MQPQHYPIDADTLYGGEYPGDGDPKVARARLQGLVDLGIRTFIDLTSPNDGMPSYEGILEELASETGIGLRRISMPVGNMSVVNSDEAMQMIMNSIRDSIRSGPAVYIHCWLGIGRTGTVAGCWLRECGLDPEVALNRVQHLYSSHMAKVRDYPESPQTRSQKNFVWSWHTSD